MKAVVPAAGEGTRLRPLTEDRPKPLVEVAGEPLLAHVLRSLRPLEPEAAVVVVGRMGDRVVERFGDRFEGLELAYVRQERPEGLARAVLEAEPLVEDELVVMNGDNVYRADLRPVVERRRAEGLDAVLLVERVAPEEARQGVCLTDGEGRVERLVEYPTAEEREAGRVAAGFYAFGPAVFDACRRVGPSEEGEYELTDAVNLLLEEGSVGSVPLEGRRVNVNTAEDLEAAERLLAP